MGAHSAILGGSTAARLLACPASYLESQKAPVGDVESSYAAEGTMLHGVVADCVQRKLTSAEIRDRGYVGVEILTEEQNETIARALGCLEELKARFKGEKPWRILSLEEMLQLPTVIGAFGSVDLVITNDTIVIVLDWKFGAGIPVAALYKLDDGSEQLNAQGAFYACAARGKYKRQFRNKRIIIAIVQPRLDPPMSWAETDAEELDGFLAAFAGATLEALSRDAYRSRGDHCRFALCKSTCPLWLGPVIDLSILDPAKAQLEESVDPRAGAYGAYLSKAMELVELAETWAAEIRRMAHVYQEDGGRVPGWKLVPKRGTRQWKDPENTAAQLRTVGAMSDDIFSKPELMSVAQVEKAMKKKGIPVPPDLFQTVSTGTTITRSDDPRPEATHGAMITDIRKALKAL